MRQLERLLIFTLLVILFLTGLFSFLNNLHDYPQIIDRMLKPLLLMQGLPETMRWYRHVPNIMGLLKAVYWVMTGLEAVISVIALNALSHWVRGCYTNALKAGLLASLWGIVFWSLCFFVVGGDWFLSWKHETLKYLQADALRYIQLMFIIYVVLAHYQLSSDNEEANTPRSRNITQGNIPNTHGI